LVDRYLQFLAVQQSNPDDREAAPKFWKNLYLEFFKKWPIGAISSEVLAVFSGDEEKAKIAMRKDKEQVSTYID
jgi:hypothetical protein